MSERTGNRGYSIKPLCHTDECPKKSGRQKVLCYTSTVALHGANGVRKQPGVCYVYHSEKKELEGGDLSPGNIATSSEGTRGSGVGENGGRTGHTRPRRMGR